MEIKLYTVTDDPRKLVKTLPTASPGYDPRSGAVRGSIDILRPEVLVEGGVVLANYAYIPDFGRYYFIEEREAVRIGLQRLSLRVDVLMSWAAQIKDCPAVCSRSAANVSAFIPDSRKPEQAFRLHTVKTFSAFTYTEPSIIMITAG